jgi:hypothetical protein
VDRHSFAIGSENGHFPQGDDQRRKGKMDQFCDKPKQIGFSTGFPRIRPAPTFFFTSGEEFKTIIGGRAKIIDMR